MAAREALLGRAALVALWLAVLLCLGVQALAQTVQTAFSLGPLTPYAVFDVAGYPACPSGAPTGTPVVTKISYGEDPQSPDFGRLVKEGSAIVRETRQTTNSAGDPEEIREVLQTGATPVERLTKITYDANGRPVLTQSGTDQSLRIERWIEYEANSGRVIREKDGAGNETNLTYDAGVPWPRKIQEKETVPGMANPIESTWVEITRDVLGRSTREKRQDGTTVDRTYDEAGNVLTETSGAGTGHSYTQAIVYDSAGKPVKLTETGGRETSWGYDRDGRITTHRTKSGMPPNATAAQNTLYEYDPGNGRLLGITHADGTHESLVYEPDGMVREHVQRSGVRVTNTYDAANRLTLEVPSITGSPQNPPLLDGGTRYTYDILSRPRKIERLLVNGSVNANSVVEIPAYDMLSRPQSERIGTRSPLEWTYDIHGNTTSVRLPQGIGYDPGKTFRGYGVAHDGLDRITALCGDPAGCGSYDGSLGATWSWGGRSRLYSVVNRGPMKTAHRYVWAYGAVPQTSQWRLGNLAIGSYGTNDLAEKWGQFSYGYRPGDAYKETRNTSNLPSQPNANTGLFTQQGFRWTLDGARRLQKAEAGAFDAFNLEYGAGDELKTNTREASGELTDYKAGARGRITERTGTAFTYDAEGRRLSDDRFDLQWNWRGELVKATVRLDWTGSPHAGHQIRFEYDALGRLLTREHRGGIPDGGTDDQRPLIEKREYLWDGESLLAETASDTAGTLKWRKTYVPGASGLDDAVQLQVENYQAGGVPERLFSYLRDELGTVTGLIEESQSGNPRAPPVAIRYFYDAFGSAHAELGPEVVKTKFEQELTQITKPDGSPATQTTTAATQPGTLRILFTSPVTAATLETGVILEKLTSGTWTALTAGERALGFSPDSPEELLILPLAGWEKNGLYRVRLTANLKDASDRSVVTPPVIQALIPEQTAPLTFDASHPLLFETAFASGETSSGLFPGGQPMLFAGAWSDPVLGFSYHRARWRDARNGVFLTEDPDADRDSRNYYAYAAFAPQQFTDARGKFIDTAIDIFTTAYDVANAATEYARTGRISEETRNDLLMDAAGVLIPGVSAGMVKGGAKVWKHIRKGDNALDAARAVSMGAKKAADGVDLAQDVAKAGRRIENGAEGVADASKFERRGAHAAKQADRVTDANQAARKVEPTADSATGVKHTEGTGCNWPRAIANSFPEGTLVATPDGEKPIEDVMPGESVFAYDELANSFTLQPVAFRFVYQKDETLALVVNGEEIVTTAGHPFFSPGKGWVEAGKLAIGDGLLTLSGEPAKVEGLERKQGEFGLFNFEVEIDHSFFVGKSGVLVHNACPRINVSRPTWQSSQNRAAKLLGGFDFEEEVSFLHGREITARLEGTVRPDILSRNLRLAVDVKNYDMGSRWQRHKLVKNIAEQVSERAAHLPKGYGQGVIIDIKNQNPSQKILDSLVKRIRKRTDGVLGPNDIHFMR